MTDKHTMPPATQPHVQRFSAPPATMRSTVVDLERDLADELLHRVLDESASIFDGLSEPLLEAIRVHLKR